MERFSKLRERILAGGSDANVRFARLCQLMMRLGFNERVRGSHHISTHDDIPEIINLQPRGTKAKPYQVKQIRNIMVKCRLGEANVDSI